MSDRNELQQTLLELHYGLLDEAEAATWRRRIETDTDVALAWAEVLQLAGRSAEFVVPASLKLPKDARLQVTAWALDGSLTTASTSFPLEPTRCLTYLTVDRPLYRPGETISICKLPILDGCRSRWKSCTTRQSR